MIKTTVPDYYEVEKVLKTRKVGNKTESLVKWKGWPDKYNSWIGESQIYNKIVRASRIVAYGVKFPAGLLSGCLGFA